MFFKAGFEVFSNADVPLTGITLTSKQIDVVHFMPAEALAKAGGGEGNRTPVLDVFRVSIYTFS